MPHGRDRNRFTWRWLGTIVVTVAFKTCQGSRKQLSVQESKLSTILRSYRTKGKKTSDGLT